MAERKYFLVHLSSRSAGSVHLTLAEVAYHCGLHPELIERLVRLGLIDYEERNADGEAVFDPDVVPLLRTIFRLRNHLGVNYAGIGVVLELMARIESLESQIRELESKISGDG
jgi:DNA-binding transcriptional MerR regulator